MKILSLNFTLVSILGAYSFSALAEDDYVIPTSKPLYETKDEEKKKPKKKSNILLAQEYTAPTSKPLYDSNGEVGEALNFPSGLFIGGALGFGQSRRAGGSENPTAAFTGSAEVGYTFGTGSWSRFETSFEGFFGQIGDSKTDMPIGAGLIAKIGKGSSLGNKMFGVWRFGAGVAQAKFERKHVSGAKFNTPTPIWGMALQGGYSILMPLAKYLSLQGGFEMTHYEFNIDELETESGTKFDSDESIVLNVPEFSIGVRLGI